MCPRLSRPPAKLRNVETLGGKCDFLATGEGYTQNVKKHLGGGSRGWSSNCEQMLSERLADSPTQMLKNGKASF